MRNAVVWTLAVIALVIAIPAQLLMFASEKIGDWADELDESGQP